MKIEKKKELYKCIRENDALTTYRANVTTIIKKRGGGRRNTKDRRIVGLNIPHSSTAAGIQSIHFFFFCLLPAVYLYLHVCVSGYTAIYI